ncbi:hypothetical protein C8J56DRAFT_1055648 [Mycena floridula]|nr:hypothetical protein C8J56DRAFT_1055648 [Mycena floridula]
MPLPAFPQETVDDFMNHIASDGDERSIRACSFVCRAWGTSSRRILFERIELALQRPYDTERLFNVFTNNTSLAGYVKELEINLFPFPSSSNSATLVSILDKICGLRLTRLEINSMSLSWRDNVRQSPLQSSILRLLSNSDMLSQLSIENAWFDNFGECLHIVSIARHITRLALSNIKLKPGGSLELIDSFQRKSENQIPNIQYLIADCSSSFLIHPARSSWLDFTSLDTLMSFEDSCYHDVAIVLLPYIEKGGHLKQLQLTVNLIDNLMIPVPASELETLVSLTLTIHDDYRGAAGPWLVSLFSGSRPLVLKKLIVALSWGASSIASEDPVNYWKSWSPLDKIFRSSKFSVLTEITLVVELATGMSSLLYGTVEKTVFQRVSASLPYLSKLPWFKFQYVVRTMASEPVPSALIPAAAWDIDTANLVSGPFTMEMPYDRTQEEVDLVWLQNVIVTDIEMS